MTPTDSEAMALLKLFYQAAKVYLRPRSTPVARERLDYAMSQAKAAIDASKCKTAHVRMPRGKVNVARKRR
jgi:hypothetical protein